MLFRNIFLGLLLLLASCCNEQIGSRDSKFQTKTNKIDSIPEKKNDYQSPCFLKLAKNTINVEASALTQYYGNVLIEYSIAQSKITDSVRIYKLFLFDKKSDLPLFNSDSGYKIEDRLNRDICAGALKNLKISYLSCNDSNLKSWGRIAMRVTFSRQ